ncbi:MAG: regulatory protein RecX [Treponema sp.]|uniref:regulatory protein RecX n=1 Tax=Treponema sp. TaxID=166 RepID=UPI00298E9951|nr:regulatory protein RecX [Treponema sp.]MBR5933942.1 regulatory protein RecX [Treponema sp.]
MAGPSFFIRSIYLTQISVEEITEGAEFLEDRETELVNAGLCFAAEQKALDYLNRSEQYRMGLTSKLMAKGFDKFSIEKALDYLESKKYLDDRRFARIWLNNRRITHAEGRIKLSKELAARGIDKEFIKEALDEFFEENPEEALCMRAYRKCMKLKKSQEKTISYLLKNGFALKLILETGNLYATED